MSLWRGLGIGGALAFLLGTLTGSALESPGLPRQEADPGKEIQSAGERGASFLGAVRPIESPFYRGHPLHELTALALLVWDQSPDQGRLSACLSRIRELPWDHTYNVALRACVDALLLERNPEDLESFVRLAMAAKFLCETQLSSGLWSYGMGYLPGGSGYLKEPASARLVAEQVAAATAHVTAYGRQLAAAIKRVRESPGRLKKGANAFPVIAVEGAIRGRLKEGDFSNSQMAALGLAAAARARFRPAPEVSLSILLPAPVLESALRSWVESQNPDGGWGYDRERKASYLSMTAGGLFSLSVLQELARRHPSGASSKGLGETLGRVGQSLEKAKVWLERHFSADSNVRVQDAWPEDGPSLFAYYALFSVERAATAAGLARLGNRDWYLEGARRLLRAQSADGGWPEETVTRSEGQESPEARRARRDIATCFALLFLKRATARLVPKEVPTPREHR